MEAFEYAAPNSVKEAVGLLSSNWGEADVLAGGTDLLSLLKEGVHTPKRVVSLKNVSGLKGVSASRVGATATIAELLGSSSVPAAVRQAAEGITSPQMRAMGTVGGELLQRPRCWYFRNGYGLLGKDAKGKSLAPNGENQYHAILGNKGPAYFVSASSLAPALIALEATVTVTGPDGEDEMPLEKLFQTPSSDSQRENTLRPNQVLTGINLPGGGARSATYEVRQRQLMDWPLASASVALKMSGDTVESARVVLGHVAPTPWRSSDAENALAGKAVSEDTAMAAAKAALSAATPLSRNKHKVQLARVAVKRAILQAAG